MNLLSNITYNFTVNASVVGLQEGYALRNASVMWVFLTPPTLQCPEAIFPANVNISMLVNYTQIFPEYRINC